MRLPFRALGLLAAFLLLADGSGCSSAGHLRTVLGVAHFVEPTGQTQTETTVDFGALLLDTEAVRDVLVRNDGTAPFTIHEVRAEGSVPGSFRYSEDAFVVWPNEQVPFRVGFRPTSPGDWSGRLELLVANGAPTVLTLTLKGTGVEGRCDLSATVLDFGTTPVGSGSARQVTVFNRSALAWPVTVDPLDAGGGVIAFEFGAGFAAGAHSVPAMNPEGTPGELVIPVEFRPGRVGDYDGVLVLHSQLCPSSVALHGTGLEHMLDCAPASGAPGACRVDFGFVSPGARAVRQVVFRNGGDEDVTLTLRSIVQPGGQGAPFALESAARSYLVPAGGAPVSVRLAFTPSLLGEQTGRLDFASTDVNRPSGTVVLFGVGGGPQVEVSPRSLDFGKAAVGGFLMRHIAIANIGTDATPGTEDNLLLAAVDSGGAWLEKRPAISGPDARDFQVEWPPDGYGATGLAEAQSADLRVRFAPATAGRKSATLVIYSNDPEARELEVPLAGVAVELPPCNVDIRPPLLNFSSVEADRALTLSFAIVNRDPTATHECLVSLLDLSPATARTHAFALVNGRVESATLRGGDSLLVPVRFQPKLDGTYTGAVEFFISNPTRPLLTVALNGIAQANCLMLAPRELDFGSVGVNCNSRQRIVSVYNTCSTPVIIDAVAIPDGSSSAFTLTKAPPLPKVLDGGASTDLGVTYRPRRVGDDAGMVTLTLAGSPNPLVVPLAGRGDADAVQTDVFSQGDQPKVDVLLVVDNSCSMEDKQTSLAQNFGAFIHYAVQQKVDFHLAATTVSIDSTPKGGSGACATNSQCGKLVPTVGSNPRIITPATPNKEDVFSQNVRLGTGGTGDESLIRPAYLALTNPLINGHNAGFYRDEAKLAIVVVSDAADQDPLGMDVAFYESFFLNLKGMRRRNEFSFSAIVPLQSQPPTNGCSYDPTWDSPRVMQLVQRTGGVAGEICDPAWAQTLERLGPTIFGQRTTFFLSNVPDLTAAPQPILVTVDGQPLEEYGPKGERRWDYSSADNAIVFEPLAAPDPGTTLSVSYHVACL